MKSMLLFANCLMFLGGCSANKISPYEIWSSLSTPEVFDNTSNWSFVIFDKEGEIRQRLELRFTNIEAQTCASQEWKKIEIVSEFPARHGSYEGEPAYYLKGAALIIDLSANLCDAGYELRGQLQEIGITGNHSPVSMFGGEVQGRFYGVPVKGA